MSVLDPEGLATAADAYLHHLTLRRYAPTTIRRRGRELTRFLTWLEAQGLSDADDLRPAVLAAWLAAVRRTAPSAKAVAYRLEQVRGFCRWLLAEGRLSEDPTAEIAVGPCDRKHPFDALSYPEAAEVLIRTPADTLLGLRDRAILELLYSCGLRRSEACNLTVDDIQVRERWVVVRAGKNRKDRLVPIGERALGWIERYRREVRPCFVGRAVRDPGTLFVTQAGRRLAVEGLQCAVKKAFVRAGLNPRGCVHVWRHTCATHLVAGGASVAEVARMLGHAQVRTTGIYTHVDPAALRRAVAAADTAAAKAGP